MDFGQSAVGLTQTQQPGGISAKHFLVCPGSPGLGDHADETGPRFGFGIQSERIVRSEEYPLRSHRSNLLKLLIDKGADLNETDTTGATALDIAQRSGWTDMVTILRKASTK